MREYQIRPCSVLTFDSDREKDLIKVVTSLKDRKKLGILTAHLIRIALESPETYGTRNEVNQVLSKLDELGVTPTRYNYFNQISKEVAEMKAKIDAVYDMAYKMYMLALAGKRLGLEEKSDNMLMASFLLERQVSDLCSAIGVDNLNHIFSSNKLDDTHQRANESLEYIIESYDNVIKELKNSVTVSTQIVNPISPAELGITSKATEPTLNKVDYHDDSELIQLTERKDTNNIENIAEKDLKFSTPTGDRAEKLKRMMKSKKPVGG